MTVIPKINKINPSISSTYLLESSYLWHGRLRQINYDTLRRLINLDQIPKFKIESNHKCPVCVEEKFTRLYFQSV